MVPLGGRLDFRDAVQLHASVHKPLREFIMRQDAWDDPLTVLMAAISFDLHPVIDNRLLDGVDSRLGELLGDLNSDTEYGLAVLGLLLEYSTSRKLKDIASRAHNLIREKLLPISRREPIRGFAFLRDPVYSYALSRGLAAYGSEIGEREQLLDVLKKRRTDNDFARIFIAAAVLELTGFDPQALRAALRFVETVNSDTLHDDELLPATWLVSTYGTRLREVANQTQQRLIDEKTQALWTELGSRSLYFEYFAPKTPLRDEDQGAYSVSLLEMALLDSVLGPKEDELRVVSRSDFERELARRHTGMQVKYYTALWVLSALISYVLWQQSLIGWQTGIFYMVPYSVFTAVQMARLKDKGGSLAETIRSKAYDSAVKVVVVNLAPAVVVEIIRRMLH